MSSQDPSTLLSILRELKNALVGIFSTRPLIPKSSSRYSNPLVTAPRAPVTIGIIITFMFYIFFFNSLASSWFLSLF